MLRRVMHHLLKVPGKARRVSLHMNAVAQCQRHRQPGDRYPCALTATSSAKARDRLTMGMSP